MLVAVSFLLASLGDPAAAKATQSSHSLDGLVAICGDGGIRYVRIDGFDGQAPASDDCSCSACLCCVIGCGGLADLSAPDIAAKAHASFTLHFTTFAPDALPVAAEQYWAPSRGPPDPKEEKPMTTMHVCNAAPVACFAESGGRFSCF